MVGLRLGALATFACVGLTGCLSSDLRILVRADGSGTITSTLKVTRSGLDQFNVLASGQQPFPRDNSAVSMLPDAARMAWALGPSVRLLRSSADRWPQGEGRTAVYAFDAIDALAIDAAFPVFESTRIASDVLGMDVHGRLDTRLSFALRRGNDGTAILTVTFADQRLDPSAGASRTDKKPANTPEDIAVLRRLVKGARMTLTIETATPLVRTSSPYAEQNQVVLLDLDVERIALSDDVDRLWGFQPASLDEVRWAVHDLPGASLALDRQVTIEFQDVPTSPAAAAQAPPDTDVYLATLSRTANGGMTVGAPVNITSSPGYDNQPSFDPTGTAIYFASVRGGGASRAPDFFRYDIAKRTTTRITNTPEGEYSPTVTQDGGHLSVARVEAGGTQRLWRLGLDGSDPQLVLAGVNPVGCHAWAGPQRVAAFVLGSPPTLQLADRRTGKAEPVARDIGRSLQRIPSGGISFVQRRTAAGGPSLSVMRLDPETRSVTPLVDLMPGVREPYVAWTPDDAMLVATDDSLYLWREGSTGWHLISDLHRLGLRGVSRLAVSPRGDRLAIVAAAQ